MNDTKYTMFVKAVEKKSLALAAQELCCTPSAVSHGISALESELGIKLMKRSRGGVELTPEGEHVIDAAKEVLAAMERVKAAADEARQGLGRIVRIGAFTSVAVHWLPGMIKSFEEVCPQAQFKLLNGDYHDINTWLEQGSIDIGFVTMPDYPKNCRAVELKTERLLAVLPKEHPLAGLESFPVAAVENESFISIMENSANDARRALDMAGVTAHVKYTTKDDYAVIAMVEQGLGISIMPELLLSGLTHHVKLMPLDNGASRIIGAAVPAKNSGNATAEKFITHMQSWLKKRYG
jgi:DNA-binding transcriptional LysR family regulator